VEGEVVFAGYGLTVPGKPGEVTILCRPRSDEQDCARAALRAESVEPQRRQELNRYPDCVTGDARGEHGAKAILVRPVRTRRTPARLCRWSVRRSLCRLGIVVFPSALTSSKRFSPVRQGLKSLQTALDTENPHTGGGFLIPKFKVKIAAAVERIKKTRPHVLVICRRPVASVPRRIRDARRHYDHLGHGESTGSRENKEGAGRITTARMTTRRRRHVARIGPASLQRNKKGPLYITAWLSCLRSGRAKNSPLGSSYFAEHPLLGLSNVVAYLNSTWWAGCVTTTDSSRHRFVTLWRRLIEKRNVVAGSI